MAEPKPNADGEIPVAPYVRRFLNISSAHLDYATIEHLSLYANGNSAETDHGWWVEVPTEDWGDPSYPKPLRDAFLAARERGCLFILFDEGAEVLEGLTVFVQEEKPDAA
jgi:hypothetical protein